MDFSLRMRNILCFELRGGIRTVGLQNGFFVLCKVEIVADIMVTEFNQAHGGELNAGQG